MIQTQKCIFETNTQEQMLSHQVCNVESAEQQARGMVPYRHNMEKTQGHSLFLLESKESYISEKAVTNQIH